VAQFKRVKRPISGVILLDKRAGISSNQALQQIKHLFQAEKAGHTGSLDPFATGLLPICLGEATKFSHFLLDADKAYCATMRLGVTTTTGDTEGEVLDTLEVKVNVASFVQALEQFKGEIKQVPPMYSALKHQGKALYEYARAGIEIEREARAVTIHALELENLHHDVAMIKVVCSKGTYIRTLAEDIGKTLGCGAHLTALRRLETGGLKLENALTFAELEAMPLAERDTQVLPTDILVQHLPRVTLDHDSAFYLGRGQAVWKSGAVPAGLLRLYESTDRFLGLGELDVDGKIAPRRLVVYPQGNTD
jgi:tRNA pseudouridine55 synthase